MFSCAKVLVSLLFVTVKDQSLLAFILLLYTGIYSTFDILVPFDDPCCEVLLLRLVTGLIQCSTSLSTRVAT